jgi:hypothetical protein
MSLAGTPAVYHCHHFNLFLDQTIDDALGSTEGPALRFTAARHASHDLLASLVEREGAATPVERLELAAKTFAAMGHGRLAIVADASGGTAHGDFLHYGFSWREKYGQLVKRRLPADAFAAGFAAAAIEVAFDLPRESMGGVEQACVALRAPRCEFAFAPGIAATPPPHVGDAECRANVRPTFGGQREEAILAIASGLRDFTAGVAGDARGLVQAFGVFVTMHLAGYYNRISYDTLHLLEKRAPRSVGVFEDLLRESGQVCVFNTFGGILLSPEWEGLVGPLTGDPAQVVEGCVAIARALGFGHWTIAEFEADKRLVLRTPSSYESAYYLARHGNSTRASEYFFQGATTAIALLAHRVDWKSRPKLTQEYYNALFRAGTPQWKAEQTACIACDDARSEVVVTRAT